MIKNEQGHVYVITEGSNGHVTVHAFESVEAQELYKSSPTPENQPAISGVHLNTKFTEAKASAIVTAGLTVEQNNQKVLEEVFVAETKVNPQLLLRTKWEVPVLTIS